MLDLRETPGYLLRRCQQRAKEIFKEEMGQFGLTQRQTALLIVLASRAEASIQDLADATGVDRNTLGEVTHRLVRRGLIERRRGAKDARAYELRVSSAGLALVHRMVAGIALVQRRIVEPLDEAERALFIRMLRDVALIEPLPAGSGDVEKARRKPRGRAADNAGTGQRPTRRQAAGREPGGQVRFRVRGDG